MFGFGKSVKERIEPEFDRDDSSSQESEKSLANILGAEENDTNITAGVDAILDEDSTLDNQQTEINQNIDFGYLDNSNESTSDTDTLTEELVQQFSEDQESSSHENEPVSPDMDWNTETESSEGSEIDNITEEQENAPVDDMQETFETTEEDSSENFPTFSESDQTQENFGNDIDVEALTTDTATDDSLPSFFTEGANSENDTLSSEDFSDAEGADSNSDFTLDDILGETSDNPVEDITQDEMSSAETDDALNDLQTTDDFQGNDAAFDGENFGTESEPSFDDASTDDALNDLQTTDDFQGNDVAFGGENFGTESEPSFDDASTDDALNDLQTTDDFQSNDAAFDGENFGTENEPSFDDASTDDALNDLQTTDDFQSSDVAFDGENSESNEISFEENPEETDESSFMTDEAEEDNGTSIEEDESEEESFSEEKEAEPEEVEPFTISEGSYESYDDTLSEDSVKVDLDNDLWAVSSLEDLCEKPKVINSNSGTVTWGGDKYQSDLKIEIESLQEIENWNMLVLHDFSVPLDENATELVIDKAPDVVRFASLMYKGQEKLKVFNQSSYKFIAPQGEFFAVQGNVICGHVNKNFSLNIRDYVRLPVQSMLNQYVGFKQPASGFILGPKGVTVFFATAKGVAFVVKEQLPEAEVFEYEPSLKKFDSRKNFVYDEQSGTSEFMATGKQTCLIVNTGTTLFGWNVHFDDETYLSLKDTLSYQAKHHKLPSANGEIIHDGKIFRFFGVEKIQARPKVLYYSYGKM